MKAAYVKPVVSIDCGVAEGVYAASGSGAFVDISSLGIYDRWTGGGKYLLNISWAGVSGNITVTINFNDTIDDLDTSDATVSKSILGKSIQLRFAATATNPLTVGIHLNHNTSIDDLKVLSTDYSIS